MRRSIPGLGGRAGAPLVGRGWLADGYPRAGIRSRWQPIYIQQNQFRTADQTQPGIFSRTNEHPGAVGSCFLANATPRVCVSLT